MGPVGDLGERFSRALKPGGYLLIEHFAGGFEAGSLSTLFKGLDVLRYSEDEDFPDYDSAKQGPRGAVSRTEANRATSGNTPASIRM